MANGTTRLAQARITLRNGQASEELAEEKKLDTGSLPKMPLKYPSEHNHSK